MKRFFLIAAMLIAAAAAGQAQEIPNLPNDPATRVGKLDNGLTYYIRHNGLPEKRAEFYLATNVGAIQETPDQDGLAHFLEHMCFNGTKNFPGKGILNWLESIGASFGGNVNASTGVEQTVYLLNNIPLIRPTVVDTCILIMHDYSHFVTLAEDEIDKERGVILEEKRTRNTAGWRMHEQMMPYLYGDTKYNGCTIIGSEENLKTFKPESIRNFYKTWYRPDMQALIVVGDIDVDEVEAKIKSIFADIPAAENPQQKAVIPLPKNEEPIAGIIADPENSSFEVEVIWKSDAMPEQYNSTPIGFTTDIAKDIIGTIINERLNDIASAADAPFLAGNCFIGNLCETTDILEAGAMFKDGEALPALKALMTEMEKVRRFGFTDGEVERAKANVLASYESAANKADTRKNSEFVMPMISHFFDNESFLDPATAYQLAQQVMPQMQPAVLNQIASALITRENMIVLYEGTVKEGPGVPTEAQLLEVVKGVENADIQQAAGEEIPSSFLDASKLKAGKVKKTEAYAYGSEILTFKNGVKVILLPNENEKDRIRFDIVKKGGKSLITDADLYSFDDNVWNLYLRNTGVAGFSSTTTGKMLAGKNLSVNPYIEKYTHGVSGYSAPKDIETALQLLYLMYTEPRFDETEYNQGISQLKAVLPNLENQPSYKLQKELYKTLYNSPRVFMISEETLEKANLATLERVYRNLFKDVNGAVMTVVGDFDKKEILPLIRKYVGSLPKGNKVTTWMDCGDNIVNGKVTNDFKTTMQTPKVTVAQVFKNNKAFSIEDKVANDALCYILNMVYTETLREDEGGTYGASVFGENTKAPAAMEVMQVVFETNPESADKLRELALDGIRKIAENGPTAEMYDKTVKNLEKKIPERKINNGYWENALQEYFLHGVETVDSYEAAVKALTPDKVKAKAKAFLESGNFVELVMRPEGE